MLDWTTLPLPKLMVAPNGARKTKRDHPAIPLTVADVVADAASCHAAGANAVHFHVRDTDDRHVFDAGQYREGIAELASQCPQMHVQITTETAGRYGPEDIQKIVRDVIPPGASIGVAELIPSRVPSDDDIRFYGWLMESGVRIQHICYTPQDVALLAEVLKRLPMTHRQNVWCLFVLGHYTGAISHPDMLRAFLNELHRSEIDGDWAICAFGKQETDCLVAAIKAGGKVRVGFENSMIMQDGSLAKNNLQRVQEACSLFPIL